MVSKHNIFAGHGRTATVVTLTHGSHGLFEMVYNRIIPHRPQSGRFLPHFTSHCIHTYHFHSTLVFVRTTRLDTLDMG